MPREFDCNGLMSTVPGDDGGCTCFGCKANRAIADAVKEERERCAKLVEDGYEEGFIDPRHIADYIRQEPA